METAEADCDGDCDMTSETPGRPCQACGAVVEERFPFCTMCGVAIDVPGQLEGWLEQIIDDDESEKLEVQRLTEQKREEE